jgi:selenophosphate synthase
VFPTDENVIIGLERADDAGVYRISDDLALIQTVDFFTTIVDDPYWFGQVPVIPEAENFAAMGLIPADAYKKRDFREQMITFAKNVPRTLQDLLFDPQTSGGLMISVSNVHCNDLVSALKEGGIADAVRIGDVVDSQEEIISVI